MVGPVEALLLIFLIAPAADEAPTPSAQELFERAQQQFRDEDYAAAASSLEAAYGLEPSPQIAYAWAQAARLDGDCETAIERYGEFLASDPPEGPANAAQLNLDRCEETVAEAREAEERRQAEAEQEERERQRAKEEERAREEQRRREEQLRRDARPEKDARPWMADPLGASLSSLGIVGIAIGAGLLGGARGDTKRRDEAGTHEGYTTLTQRALVRQRAGATILAIGGAALVGGVVRYIVVARRGARDTAKLKLTGLGVRF